MQEEVASRVDHTVCCPATNEKDTAAELTRRDRQRCSESPDAVNDSIVATKNRQQRHSLQSWLDPDHVGGASQHYRSIWGGGKTDRTMTTRTVKRHPRRGANPCLIPSLTAVTSLVVLSLTVWQYEQQLDQFTRMNTNNNNPAFYNNSVIKSTRSTTANHEHDYIMWSKEESYFHECLHHFIGNETWGEQVAPYADKLKAKELVKQMGTSMRIVPTITHFDERNISSFTLDFMKKLPDPCIIKPTHASGEVARIRDGTYNCFKDCFNGQLRGKISEKLHRKALQNMQFTVENKFSANETQYWFIPRRIIVEEHLDMENIRDVTYWYIANGQPLFVSLECDTKGRRVFLSTRFKVLPMKLKYDGCKKPPIRPNTWDEMLTIAVTIAKHVPAGAFRLDLYASETEVFFSEFTFTTTACRYHFKPYVADGLMYAVLRGHIDPKMATAEFVERTIGDTSWTLVFLNGLNLLPTRSGVFPSPVDLCEELSKWTDPSSSSNEGHQCLLASKRIASSQLRCLVASKDGPLVPLGAKKIPTFSSVMDRVDWDMGLLLFLAITVLTYFQVGAEPRQNRFLGNCLYLGVLIVYSYCFKGQSRLFSSHSVVSVVKQSFNAFVIVHPMTSPWIAISHFSTYWFLVASWNAKSVRNMLLWQLLYETVTASVNEYGHHLEHINQVRCMRMAFIHEMKHSAFDDVIRQYILPPFFVYGYLLPASVFNWAFNSIILMIYWTFNSIMLIILH